MASKFPSLKDITQSVAASITSVATTISDTFGDKKFVKSVKTAQKNIKVVTKLFESVQSLLESLMEFFIPKNIIKLKLMSTMMSKMDFSGFSTGINNLIKGLNDIKFDNVNKKKKSFESFIGLINDIKKLVLSCLVLSTVTILGAAVIIPGLYATKFIVNLIFDIVGSLGNLNKDAKKDIKDAEKTILMIGATFVLFALTLYTLGEVAVDPALIGGMVAFGGIILMCLGFLWALGNRHVKHLTRDGQLTILAIGATFVLFALTLYTLGEVAVDPEMIEGMAAFGALVGIALGTLFMLSKMKSEIKNGALSLLEIGATLLAFTVVLWALNKLDLQWKVLPNIIALALISGVAAGVMMLMDKIKGSIVKGSFAMAILGGAFMVFIADLVILNNIDIQGKMWVAFGALAAMVILAGGTVFGLSLISGPILVGAVAMIAMGGAFLLFISAIKKLNDMSQQINLESTLTFMGVLVCVMGEYVVLGALSTVAVAASLLIYPAISMLSSSLTMTANAFKDIASIDIEKISGKITPFMDTIKDVMGKYNGLWKSFFLKGNNVSQLSISLIGMANGISTAADAFKKVAELDVDFQTVASNIELMVSSTIGTFTEIANRKEVKGALQDNERNSIGKIFGKTKRGTSAVARVLSVTGQIGAAIGDLAVGVQQMANLVVDVYDKNGKVIEKRKLTDNDFKLAGEGVAKIVGGFCSALAEHKEDILNNFMMTGVVIDQAKVIAEALGGFGENIAIFASGKVKYNDKIIDIDFETAGTNIAKLFSTVVNGIKDIHIKKLIKGNITEDITRLMEPINNIVDTSIKIDDKLKGKDPSKTISDIVSGILPIIKNINDAVVDNKTGLVSDKAIKDIERFGDAIKKVSDDNVNPEGLRSSAESIDNVINSVNKVDMSKLEKVNTLVDGLGKIGKGINWNFDKLANTINGQLVKALDGVKEILEETNETLTKLQETTEKGTEAQVSVATTLAGDPVVSGGTEDSKNDPAKALAQSVQLISSNLDKLNQTITKIENGTSILQTEVIGPVEISR